MSCRLPVNNIISPPQRENVHGNARVVCISVSRVGVTCKTKLRCRSCVLLQSGRLPVVFSFKVFHRAALNRGHLALSPQSRSWVLTYTQLSLWLCLIPSLSFCELVIHPLCESGRVGIWKTAVPVTVCQFTFSFPYSISLSFSPFRSPLLFCSAPAPACLPAHPQFTERLCCALKEEFRFSVWGFKGTILVSTR